MHELRRVDDRTAFVVFSTRPTEETIRRLGPIRSRVDGLGTRPLTEKEVAEFVAQGQPEEETRKLLSSRIASPAKISLKDYRTEINANLAE